MKNLMLITTLALLSVSLAGCHLCGQSRCGLFDRGDRCNTCPPPDCSPGMPRATMMVPSSPQMIPSGTVLPGPIEIAPQS